MSIQLHGLVAAAHTPFDSSGALNLQAVEALADHLEQNGITAAFITGTTGECHSLTVDERLALTKRWMSVTRSSALQVVVHVGANCLADSRALAKQAESLNAAAISALSPSYFKPRTLDDLIECCRLVAAEAPGTPFYYYDIPSMTGVQFPMLEFLERAGERIPTLAGVKYSNPDMMTYQRCLHLPCNSGMYDVPWGIDEWLLAAFAVGARGGVGSSYNFAAPVFHRMIKAYGSGDLAAARNEQYRAVQLIQLVSGYGYMAAAKHTMELLGVPVGRPRLPITSLTDFEKTELTNKLDQLGFFEWVNSMRTA